MRIIVSGSMAYDSLIYSGTIDRLGLSQVEGSLDDIWTALVASGVGYSDDGGTSKFPSSGYGGINSAEGTYLSSSNVSTVLMPCSFSQWHMSRAICRSFHPWFTST